VPYPLNTPLGRFGIETSEEGPERCVASIPSSGRNPLTGLATVAPLAMLVDHVGGLINHLRRGPQEWTVSSELCLEVDDHAVEIIAGSPDLDVVAVSRPLGRKGVTALGMCELSVGRDLIATATVRSFYIDAPAGIGAWPDGPAGSLPGTTLGELMAVQPGEAGGTTAVLMQRGDPVLNNIVGTVHGGVSSMGLELVGSAALNSGSDQHQDGDTNQPYRTGSLRVNFLRPFHGGAQAHYRATPVRIGRRSGVAEMQAVGGDGSVALLARLTAYR